MTVVHRLGGEFNITDPDWPTFPIWEPGEFYTSDDFSRDGEPVGRNSDAWKGGTPLKWDGHEGVAVVGNGGLQAAGIAGPVLWETPGQDYEISFKFSAVQTSGTVGLAFRRSDLVTGSSSSGYILNIAPGSGASGTFLRKTVTGTNTTLTGFTGSIKNGDTVTIRVQGPQITITDQAGQVLLSVMDAGVPTGKYAGLYLYPSTAGLLVDWISIKAL